MKPLRAKIITNRDLKLAPGEQFTPEEEKPNPNQQLRKLQKQGGQYAPFLFCSEFQSLGPPLLARAKWTAKPFLPWKAFRAKDYYEHRIAVPES